MKLKKISCLGALVAFYAASAGAADQQTYVPSLDPANRGYINNFCQYHPSSPICVAKPKLEK